MKRRWVIRGFLIGLLLLCVGGWGFSYRYYWAIRYSNKSNVWTAAFNWGRVHVEWLDGRSMNLTVAKEGWHVEFNPASAANGLEFVAKFDGHRWLGFFVRNSDGGRNYVGVPFYFPTAISAALLWFAWRKTLPKPKGRAFPMEATPTTSTNEAKP